MKSLSIIIPAYNEENRILPTLKAVNEFFREENLFYEIIIVNDGSLDSTVKVVEEYKKNNPDLILKISTLSKNMGKGMAVKKGIEVAQNEIIMFFDADLSYEP